VVQRASLVRAAAFRRSAFSLAKTCSIGFRSASRTASRAGSRPPPGSPRGRPQPCGRGDHDGIAGPQARGKHLLYVGAEHFAGHRPIQHARGDHAIAAQASDEGCCLPVSVGRRVDQALATWTPAVEPRHRGGRPRLVEEDKALGIHVALPGPPMAAVSGNVGPVLLGRPERLFCATDRAGGACRRWWKGPLRQCRARPAPP
jgi:hypothetical protein